MSARRSGLTFGAVVSTLMLACILTGCRIEDRTPTGARRDEQAIQRLLAEYHRAIGAADTARLVPLLAPGASYDQLMTHPSALVAEGATDVRITRTDLHQEGDIAAAWVTTRRGTSLTEGTGHERVELFVLRRMAGGWKVQQIVHATGLPLPGLRR